jgi:hypothetical protein
MRGITEMFFDILLSSEEIKSYMEKVCPVVAVL